MGVGALVLALTVGVAGSASAQSEFPSAISSF